VNEQDIRHALWHFGHKKGYEPGSFTKYLMLAFQNADPANRGRLAQAFPGLCSAMTYVMDDENGITALEAMLKLYED